MKTIRDISIVIARDRTNPNTLKPEAGIGIKVTFEDDSSIHFAMQGGRVNAADALITFSDWLREKSHNSSDELIDLELPVRW